MSVSITRILKVGENEQVEFKQSLSERKQILEAISAFSNSKGETVVIGIHPNNKVHGITIGANTLENLSNEIKQNTDPTIFPSIEIASIGSKRLIVTFKRVVSYTKHTVTKMKLSKTQLSILQYLKKHGGAGTSELVGFLHISDRAVQNNLDGIRYSLRWLGASANDPTGK